LKQPSAGNYDMGNFTLTNLTEPISN